MFPNLPLSSFFFPRVPRARPGVAASKLGRLASRAGRAACCCRWDGEGGEENEDSNKSDSTHSVRVGVPPHDPQTPTIRGLRWAGVETLPGER